MDLMEVDVLEPHPDIHDLFCYYNALYFHDSLGACMVSWSSGRMTLCAGICCYIGGGCCEIRLSEPLLKFRPSVDLKNTLLHEMIHAYLFVKYKNRDHGDHGTEFQKLMREINYSSAVDYQRPPGGYNITIYHNFYDEVDNYRVHHWMCKACGDLIKRAMNREPSANDCIQRAKGNQACKHPSCHWHRHKRLCNGSYEKIAEPAGYESKKSKRSRDNHDTTAASLKGLVGNIDKSTKTTRFGGKYLGNKESSDLSKYNTLEKFYCVLKKKPEISSGEKSESPSEVLQMVDEFNVSGEIESLLKISVEAKDCESHDVHRTTISQRKHCAEPKNIYDVIIKGKSFYAYEEDSDSSESLVDKRIERRKKQESDQNPGNCSSRVEVTEIQDLCVNHHSKDSADEGMDAEEPYRRKCNSSFINNLGIPDDQCSIEEIYVIKDESPALEVISRGIVLKSTCIDSGHGCIPLIGESLKDEQDTSHAGTANTSGKHVNSADDSSRNVIEVSDSESGEE